jgi:putative phosphoribosyl transferase
MFAAIKVLKQQQLAHIIVAVPVAPPSTCRELVEEGIEVVCVMQPEPFYGVGFWYEQFPQLSDDHQKTLTNYSNVSMLET